MVSTPVVTEDQMWTFDLGRNLLLSFDRETGEAVGSTPLQPTAPIDWPLAVSLVPTPTAIWVVLPGAVNTGLATRVNQASGVVELDIALDEPPDRSWVAVGEALVGTTGVGLGDPDTLVRIDGGDGEVTTAALTVDGAGVDVVGTAVGANRLWLLTPGAVLEADPGSLELVGEPLSFESDGGFFSVSGFNGRGDDLWFFIANEDDTAVARLRTAERELEVVSIDNIDGALVIEAVPVTDDVAFLPVSLDDRGVDAVLSVSIGGEQELLTLENGELEPPDVFAVGDNMLILDRDPTTLERTARLVGADGDERSASLEPRSLIAENADGALIVTDRRTGSIARVTEEGVTAFQDTVDLFGAPRVVGDEIWVPAGDVIVAFSADLSETTSIAVPDVSSPIVAEDGTVFVGVEDVVTVDPASHTVTPAFAGFEPGGLGLSDPQFLPGTSSFATVAFGAYWARRDAGVTRIDLATGDRRECATPATVTDMEAAGGSLWVVNQAGVATELDPLTCAQRATVDIGDPATIQGVGPDGVVAIELFGGEVHRIASPDGGPAAITDTRLIGAGAVSVDVAGDRLWVAYESSRELVPIDAAIGFSIGDPIPLDGRPFGVAADGDGTWVVLQDSGAAVRVDGGDLTVGEPIPLDE